MSGTEVVVALVIAIGLAGIVVPMLPGSVLVLGAILVWAAEIGTGAGWAFFAAAAALIAIGTVVKYAVPGKHLKTAGVPNSTLLVGAVVGIVGFFVVPVIGLVLGFVLGVYLAEWRRLDQRAAWPATVHALKAVGLAMLIEFTSALLAAITWGVGVLVT